VPAGAGMTWVRITESSACVLSRSALQVAAACAGVLAAVSMAMPLSPEASTVPGRIEGIVRLVASGEGPIVSGAYPSRRVNRPVQHSPEISNVIVFIKDAARWQNLSPMRARMVQTDETFTPRVIAITRGSTVEFPNSDPYFHNVFSLSRTATFDLGRYPRGQSRSRAFVQAGLIKVYCHLHSHMSASIMVFDHPYFTAPTGDGSFVLSEIPAGEYRLSAWHERIGESPKTVRVEPNATVRVEFSLPMETH
jgi:plastocyanin